MSDFPRLKTGAVLQYPARRSVAYGTQVLRFVDGTEQRFREQGAPLRRWQVQLHLLDPDELNAFERYFISMQGAAGFFSFQDPWDGSVYPRCSFENDDLTATLQDVLRGRTSLVVREERES